ncbi:3'-5' exoribonuclease [Hydrogenispora ethanolica]|uniref:3'-5' exoribonuclease n=1 Tax=Hydrogenispora ethanolica TaxID=1082276 RepID=A0A4R1R9A6_HYDET|nr:HD domain-containing protein [Hydrogenispora ethanolica]TCL62218.1 3'-5' exoribonuclease [Hydrogenispora ethanolica]
MKIREIVEGVSVSGQFLIVENQMKVAKNGNSYLAMKIGDQTGELAVKVWSADEETFRHLEVGKVIEIQNIQPKLFKDQIQLEWEAKNQAAYKIVPDGEADYSRFLPTAPGNLNELWLRLTQYIDSVTESKLRHLLAFFFDDAKFAAHFMKVPAALKRHHAYIGGLLEHTVGVASLCAAAAAYYPLVNRDILLTGAILHDIGKTKTYKLEKGFDGTDEGKLIGHLILGVEMVSQAVAQSFGPMDAAAESLKNTLLHLLVSHHGIMEWGSPVEPLTLEACILHHADNMDAQVTKFLKVMRAESNTVGWSAFDPGLGRSIWMNGMVREERELPEEA